MDYDVKIPFYKSYQTAPTISKHLITRRSLQPGKKTIIVTVSLSVLLLISQLIFSINLAKNSSIQKIFKESFEALNKRAELPSCIKTYLGNKKLFVKPEGTCEHLTPPRGFCSLIQDLFFNKSPETCNHQRQVIFCKQNKGNIKCTFPEICQEYIIFVGIFDSLKGTTLWTKVSFDNLENELNLIAKQKNYKGYVFIKCLVNSNQTTKSSLELRSEYENNSDLIQLFILPPMLQTNYEFVNKKDSNKKYDINVNFIMIDSLSRNHFYRSLPQTIEYLEKYKEKAPLSVLDFEYVQSIKQRTYESLEILFSGFINNNEKPFGTYDMPKKPLPINNLLSELKRKNYKTLWLEDMCWTWEWGLAKDLKVTNKSLDRRELWEQYQIALNNANIDNVDVTLASCEILNANYRKDPFHDTPSVCFNGKHHHEYLFEYLEQYQDTHKRLSTNLFTFLQTNVAHEETGVRIQSLDQTLKNYLQFSTSLSNTLTILFSDHGNAYGEFLRKSTEAYVETFNPFLIFLIPNDIKNIIGDVNLRIMSDNQKNLVSLLDVHETIVSLLNITTDKRNKKFKEKYVIPKGLLNNIPNKRNCLDIPVIQPNLCICKNFDIEVSINSVHYALADFCVGILNNVILEQRINSGFRGFNRCQLLIVNKIRSVRELRSTSEIIRYKLDVELSGILSMTSQQLFFFIVEVRESTEPSVRFISFERMSKYSSFYSCQDREVEIEVCICDSNSSKHASLLNLFFASKQTYQELSKNQTMKFFDIRLPFLQMSVIKRFPIENPCMYIVSHNYNDSFFNIYAISICSSLIELTLKGNFENILLSSKTFSSHLVRYLDVKLLLSGVKKNSMLRASWFFKYSITVL